jgi:hypothetical protein
LFDARAWDSVLPILKDTMDLWFGKHPKPEREFQQLVLRENNLQQPLANSTDYFFIDIEYAVGKTRFDLVGVRWPSSGPERKIRDGWPLVLVEMKYGDNAHRGLSNGGVPSGGSGLVAHMDNMIKFIQDRDRFKDFKDDILVVYGQKHQLGLIDSKHPINSFSDKPEIMFLLANHDPEKTALREELCRMQEILPAEIPADDVRFFRSSLLGYALYQDNLMTLPDMIDALRR